MSESSNQNNSPTCHLTSHKTVEDLEDQARRWVAGEMDGHDLIISNYKQVVRSKMSPQQLSQWGHVLSSDLPT